MEDSDTEVSKSELSPPRSLDSQKRVTFATTSTIHTFEPSDDEDQEIIIIQGYTSMENMKRKWTKSVHNFQRLFSKSI
jgi:hypothetical protein